MPNDRKAIIKSHEYPGMSVYTSKMTEEDFEIAGQALSMLINRLKPQEKPETESTNTPEVQQLYP